MEWRGEGIGIDVMKTMVDEGYEDIQRMACANYVQLSIQYALKYSVSFIAKRIKGRRINLKKCNRFILR